MHAPQLETYVDALISELRGTPSDTHPKILMDAIKHHSNVLLALEGKSAADLLDFVLYSVSCRYVPGLEL